MKRYLLRRVALLAYHPARVLSTAIIVGFEVAGRLGAFIRRA